MLAQSRWVSWSASYALSKAEDRVEGRWAPRTLDQTHALNIRWAFDAGRDWQISGSWQYHTGWPFTNQILDVLPVEAEDGTQTVNILQRGFGPLNDNRLPPYHRMDLRATREFHFEGSTLELFLDVFNVYDRTNLRGTGRVKGRSLKGPLAQIPGTAGGPCLARRFAGASGFDRLFS